MDSDHISGIYKDGRHYDCLFGEPSNAFFRSLAEELEGSFLELGCGTGKITISLAEAGHNIVGIDNSPSMMKHAKAKITGRDLPIKFLLGDMTCFSLMERFGTIILPSNNLCHLHSIADVENCLQSVKSHLSHGGVFIIDTFTPNLSLLLKDPSSTDVLSEYEDPDGKGKVTVTTTSTYETDTQIRRTITHQNMPDGSVIKGSLDLKMYFPQELDAALHYNGFEIIYKYGSYDKAPFRNHSNQQIIIARLQASQ